MIIKEIVTREEDYIIALRRYFHSHPEPSLKEYNTSKRIEEELDKLHIPHERVGETGIVGYIVGINPGKTIALRADIDALEIQQTNDVEYKSLAEGLCMLVVMMPILHHFLEQQRY